MESRNKAGRKKQAKLVLFPEVYTNAVKMTDAQFGILMRAVFAYRFEGHEYSGDDLAVDIAFRTVKGQIERYNEICEINSQNAGSGDTTESCEIQRNTTEINKNQQNKPPNPIPYPDPVPSPSLSIPHVATAHGLSCGSKQNVFMTQSEYDRLSLEYGETNVMLVIESLGGRLASGEKITEKHYDLLRRQLRKNSSM